MKTRYLSDVIRYMLLSLPVAFSVAGCDVHDYPETPAKVPFVLHLNCNTELPVHQEISYTTRSDNATAEHDIRYIVNIYRSDNGQDFGRETENTLVVTKPFETEHQHELPLELEEGLYKFIVWSDHVDKGSNDDKYYDTTDFGEITHASLEEYEGCNDFRDAYRGEQQVWIKNGIDADGNATQQDIVVDMERPMAKFRFIATDLTEFIDQLVEKAASKGQEVSRAVNPDDYRVVFRYTGFMPCSFNMFTNKPNDSWTGVSFDGKMVPIDGNEIELGFDYVFVNGTESKIDVAVEIYDKEGTLLSSSNAVEVPIVRSKLTIVRGDFLTSQATGNIGVDPTYNGDYNIEIK